MEDIVVKSYKEQIKQSILKLEAVQKAGFDLVVSELERRGVQVGDLVSFFNRIKRSTTKEELDQLTIDELNVIIDDIGMQVTKALISPSEIANVLVSKSRVIAKEKSPNGKVMDSDHYIKVGANLASEVNKHGIAVGISVCIKNYCIQKLYQASYREQLKLKELELGIEGEEEKSFSKIIKPRDSRKDQTMKDIFGKEIDDHNPSFTFIMAKNQYLQSLSRKIEKINEYK